MKFFRFLFQKELDQAYQQGLQDAIDAQPKRDQIEWAYERGFNAAKEASAKLCILTPQEMAEGDWGIETSYASRYFAERIRNQKVRNTTHL